MKIPTKLASTIFLIIFLLVLSPSISSSATSYEVPLPSALATDPNFCAYVPCKEVMPGADSFSERMGSPPYVEAYKTSKSPADAAEDNRDDKGAGSKTLPDGKELIGYVFLSTEIVDIPAYSGKPVATLIGMDTKGVIRGVKVLSHSEPILLVGIPETKLLEFIDQYKGKFVGDQVEIGGKSDKEQNLGVDAISGATVTAIAENRTIMKSGYKIAVQVGIIKPKPKPVLGIKDTFTTMGWNDLIKDGLVQRLNVEPWEVKQPSEGNFWINLYFGYLDQPSVGKNILGESGYDSLIKNLASGDHAIFIIGNGRYSFKGSGFVRGAIFDRIQIIQDDETFTFTDKDYFNLSDIELDGAPYFNEGGIFIIKKGTFAPAYPWSLVVLTTTQKLGAKDKEFFIFSKEYMLPYELILGNRIITREEPQWMKIWKNDIPSIIFLLIFLTVIFLIFVFKRRLVRHRKASEWLRYGILVVSIVFIGYYKMAQPSVTQAVTLTQNFLHVLSGFKWDLFLSDPLIFILWWFIGISIVLWGRGVFCGWICPYGALTELSYRIFHAIFPKRFKYELQYKIHSKLIYLKYAVFGFLILVSFYSISLTERFAEIEPFKSAFLTGPLNRELPYVIYFFLLFAVCMVSYRFFCKYLCPLGAGLAIPTTLSLLKIRRRDFCTMCNICTRNCDIGAIGPKGEISKRECMRCFNCEVNYWDDTTCPPLVVEKREHEKASSSQNVANN